MQINNSNKTNEQLISNILNVQESVNNKKTLTISIVGAGGKTHLSYWLAQFFKQLGHCVCLTTTTKMYYPDQPFIDHLVELEPITNKAIDRPITNTGSITFLYKSKLPSQTNNEPPKVKGLSEPALNSIIDSFAFDVMIVEADGAKNHPIKAPAGYEPCIVKTSQIVIGVTGAEAIFSKANSENIHRWAEFSALTGCLPEMEIDHTILKRLLNDPQGMFKNAPDQALKIWVINKYDLSNNQMALLELANTLLTELPLLNSIWLTQFNTQTAIKNVLINNFLINKKHD
jgi:probable selenium-dependent hydroxylase accessory protein YqeC